jgi:uncharacterized Tic20 family protein
MNTTPTPEDRVWAVISHLSSLAFGMGIVLPIIGWSDQRRKSNYASFQSLQALGYQSLGFTIWVLSYLVIIIIGAIFLLIRLGTGGGNSTNDVSPGGMIIFFIVVFGFFALYFALPIIGAVACAFGRDFKYPFMGDRLASYLAYSPKPNSNEKRWLNEDHEFRWVAAMGHFSILIVIWGMLAPLTTWALFGKRDHFLKFQSIQTLVYQAAATILFFGGAVLYSVGLLFLVAATGAIGSADFSSSLGIVGTVILIVILLISVIVLLLVPFLHILGQWAGYRVLKGDDYRYPLVGKLIERWITPKTPLAADASAALSTSSGLSIEDMKEKHT